ncbi:MAG: winged helix-turn-helix transcriptional regulator [Verrucomicrobia bacterium]|nr:winged helix-turn-helix transcriptional regulator [Verrucomicrobiota bacterium]
MQEKKRKSFTAKQLEQIAARFKVLGEPMRLRILEVVCREPRSVNEIVEATGATQANISKHLAILTTAGIVTREKDGQRVFYGMKDPLTVKLCELVHANLAK